MPQVIREISLLANNGMRLIILHEAKIINGAHNQTAVYKTNMTHLF